MVMLRRGVLTLLLTNYSTGHFAAEDVASRVKALNDNMESLQARAARRQNDLEANVQFQQYLADLHEAEAWIQEKAPIVDNTNYGADEEAAGVRGAWGWTSSSTYQMARDCGTAAHSVRFFGASRVNTFGLHQLG